MDTHDALHAFATQGGFVAAPRPRPASAPRPLRRPYQPLYGCAAYPFSSPGYGFLYCSFLSLPRPLRRRRSDKTHSGVRVCLSQRRTLRKKKRIDGLNVSSFVLRVLSAWMHPPRPLPTDPTHPGTRTPPRSGRSQHPPPHPPPPRAAPPPPPSPPSRRRRLWAAPTWPRSTRAAAGAQGTALPLGCAAAAAAVGTRVASKPPRAGTRRVPPPPWRRRAQRPSAPARGLTNSSPARAALRAAAPIAPPPPSRRRRQCRLTGRRSRGVQPTH